MCGIAGVIDWTSPAETLAPIATAMADCLRHRGPDGGGIWSAAGVALSHRRLAVLDPTARADQPFALTYGGRTVHTVFNGEIYNFRELRAELTPLLPGYEWRTTGDTEVLLAAYMAWGDGFAARLRGMFAVAIVDGPRVVLARDRMGEKPLFVARSSGRLAFASELSAMRRVPWIDRTTDDAALAQYLAFGYIPAPLTIHRGIRKLRPATVTIATATDWTESRYWRESRTPTDDRDTRTRVLDAVRSQLVSDVPLGAFLSGGIDSSIVAAAMTAAGGKVLTFSMAFDDPRYDESPHAEAVARHLRTEHRTLRINPSPADIIPRLSCAYGEPFADSSAIATYELARLAREHVTVALSGDGGDELFAGYDRYRAMRLGRWLRRMPAGVRLFQGAHPKSWRSRAGRFLASAGLDDARRYESYLRLFPPGMLDAPPLTGRVGEYDFTTGDVVAAATVLDRATYLPDDLLTKVDRASMAHGLEVRCPFMDAALVDHAAGLPPAELLNRGAKSPLRRAFAADLPPAVFSRRKMGFAVPMGEWLRGPLRAMTHDALLATNGFSVTRWGRPTVAAMLESHHAATADHSHRLYALLMLELWASAS